MSSEQREGSGGPGVSAFSGAGIGLLLGTIMGLSVSPTVKVVIGALAASLGALIGLNEKHFGSDKGLRIGSFGVACTLAALVGVWARTHHVLEQDLASRKAELQAIYGEARALDLLAYERYGLVPAGWSVDDKAVPAGSLDAPAPTRADEPDKPSEPDESSEHAAAKPEPESGQEQLGEAGLVAVAQAQAQPLAIPASVPAPGPRLSRERGDLQRGHIGELFATRADACDGLLPVTEATTSWGASDITQAYAERGKPWVGLAAAVGKLDAADRKPVLVAATRAACVAPGGQSAFCGALAGSDNGLQARVEALAAPWSGLSPLFGGSDNTASVRAARAFLCGASRR